MDSDPAVSSDSVAKPEAMLEPSTDPPTEPAADLELEPAAAATPEPAAEPAAEPAPVPPPGLATEPGDELVKELETEPVRHPRSTRPSQLPRADLENWAVERREKVELANAARKERHAHDGEFAPPRKDRKPATKHKKQQEQQQQQQQQQQDEDEEQPDFGLLAPQAVLSRSAVSRRTMVQQQNVAVESHAFTADEITDLHRAFERFDRDGNGGLNLEEIRLALLSLTGTTQTDALNSGGERGLTVGSGRSGHGTLVAVKLPSDDELRQMMSDVDADGSGEIEFEEFLTMMARHGRNSKKADGALERAVRIEALRAKRERLRRHTQARRGTELPDLQMLLETSAQNALDSAARRGDATDNDQNSSSAPRLVCSSNKFFWRTREQLDVHIFEEECRNLITVVPYHTGARVEFAHLYLERDRLLELLGSQRPEGEDGVDSNDDDAAEISDDGSGDGKRKKWTLDGALVTWVLTRLQLIEGWARETDQDANAVAIAAKEGLDGTVKSVADAPAPAPAPASEPAPASGTTSCAGPRRHVRQPTKLLRKPLRKPRPPTGQPSSRTIAQRTRSTRNAGRVPGLHGLSKRSTKSKRDVASAQTAAAPEPELEPEKPRKMEQQKPALKPTAPWNQPRGCQLACVTADAGQSFEAQRPTVSRIPLIDRSHSARGKTIEHFRRQTAKFRSQMSNATQASITAKRTTGLLAATMDAFSVVSRRVESRRGTWWSTPAGKLRIAIEAQIRKQAVAKTRLLLGVSAAAPVN